MVAATWGRRRREGDRLRGAVAAAVTAAARWSAAVVTAAAMVAVTAAAARWRAAVAVTAATVAATTTSLWSGKGVRRWRRRHGWMR